MKKNKTNKALLLLTLGLSFISCKENEIISSKKEALFNSSKEGLSSYESIKASIDKIKNLLQMTKECASLNLGSPPNSPLKSEFATSSTKRKSLEDLEALSEEAEKLEYSKKTYLQSQIALIKAQISSEDTKRHLKESKKSFPREEVGHNRGRSTEIKGLGL